MPAEIGSTGAIAPAIIRPGLGTRIGDTAHSAVGEVPTRLAGSTLAYPAWRAFAEPGDAARGARRRPGARARVRKPRLPPRRRRAHRAAVRRPPLDRLPAGVQGLAARAAPPAGTVHRALLPRRGDRLRRRAPAVRALPPRGLRPLRRRLERAASRRVRGGRDRRPAARRAGRPGDAAPPPARGTAARPPGRRVRSRGRGAATRARWKPPGVDAGRLPGTG